MITAATALAVAVLSGGATVYSTRSTQRLQREFRASEAKSAVQAQRTAALAEYGAAAAAFIAACSELAGELAPSNRDPAHCIAKHDVYLARWARLQEARLPAKTHAAADGALASQVNLVDVAAVSLDGVTEAWFQEVKRYDWQIDKRSPDSLLKARQACQQALAEFEDAVVARTSAAAL